MQIVHNFGYDVFISYARKDYMDPEGNLMPSSPIHRIKLLFDAAGIRYWLDVGEIIASDQYAQKITEAILESEYFLFVSSEASNSSIWTSKEIALANHYGKKIVPCRIDSSFYNSSVAFYLADIDYIDYAANPERAIDRIEKSIIVPIKTRVEEDRKREEERKKEEERLLKEAELRQNELIEDIKVEIQELDTRERDVDTKRQKLLRDITKVKSEDQQKNLSDKLLGTFGARKHQELELKLSEKDELIISLNEQIDIISAENCQLKQQLKVKHRKDNSTETNRKTKDDSGSILRKYIENWKSHSIATRILLCCSILGLIISSFSALMFASDGGWGNAYAQFLPYARLEFITTTLAAYMLYQLLQKTRVNYALYAIPAIIFVSLIFVEDYLQDILLVSWPLTIDISQTEVVFIPYGAILFAFYMIGLASCLLRNKKNVQNSWIQMNLEPVWRFIIPNRHIGLYIIVPAIIATIWIASL